MRTRNPRYDRPSDVVLGRVRPKRSSGDTLIRDQSGTEVLANEIVLDTGLTVSDDGDATAIISLSNDSGGGSTTPLVNAPLTAALSNPPTQAELQDAIGTAAGEVTGQSYLLIDSDTGYEYGVVSDGNAFVFVPLVQPDTDLVTVAAGAGVWNDFHSPHSAAAYDATSDTTFWCYMNTSGDVLARSWDHAAGTASAATTLRSALDPGDTHATPVLIIRSSDRKIVVWYCAHVGANMYQRISSAAADISAFGAETDIASSLGTSEHTYPMAVELSDGLYLFFRSNQGTGGTHANAIWSYSKSTDNGATWATATHFAKEPSYGMYVTATKTAAHRVDFLATNRAPFNEAGGSLYHFYLVNGTFYTTNGTAISAAQPFAVASMTQVWASDGTQRADPLGSVVLGADGYPRLAFVEFETVSPEDATYIWAYWDGASWTTSEVADAGSGSQTATCCLDPTNPNTVFGSKDVSGIAQIHSWTTIDNGTTWVERQITDTAAENALVHPVTNAASELRVMWSALVGGWTRDDDVAADFMGMGFVPSEGGGRTQRVVIANGENTDSPLVEKIERISSTGGLEFSIDAGTTWYGIASGIGGGGGGHVHIHNEPFVGDAAQTVFYLAQEADYDSVEAYVAGALTQFTQDATQLDKITFSAAPAAGTHYFHYIPATS